MLLESIFRLCPLDILIVPDFNDSFNANPDDEKAMRNQMAESILFIFAPIPRAHLRLMNTRIRIRK